MPVIYVGAFVGELAEPLPIAVDGGGYLSVPWSDCG
jgi:hypothetical protein